MVVNGHKVKELRESRGMTQHAAAEKAGFASYQQWSNVERDVGKSNLRVGTLFQVAQVLGVPMESLLHFVTDRKKRPVKRRRKSPGK